MELDKIITLATTALSERGYERKDNELRNTFLPLSPTLVFKQNGTLVELYARAENRTHYVESPAVSFNINTGEKELLVLPGYEKTTAFSYAADVAESFKEKHLTQKLNKAA